MSDRGRQLRLCVDVFNTNQLQTEKKERKKQNLIAKNRDLDMIIQVRTQAFNGLKAEIAEMQMQLKRAGEDTEKENKEFQMTMSDQREPQTLLKKALDFVADSYSKKAAALQKQEPVGPPLLAGSETHKNNAQNDSVMQLLEQIITEAKAMEVEAIRSEEDAQKDYEDFIKETNVSIEAKCKNVAEKSEHKTKAEIELVVTQKVKETVMPMLEQLSFYYSELHQSCVFLVKNFDLKQTAHDEEVEVLREAKGILSSAKFEWSYPVQLGEIFGIFMQMKESFESNLSASQKEEMADQNAHKDLKAENEAEMGEASLSANEQFLEMFLTSSC
jgi:hypothetical protein